MRCPFAADDERWAIIRSVGITARVRGGLRRGRMVTKAETPMLGQLVVLATNGRLDRGLDVVVPIARAAIVTDAERHADPAEHVAFVRPLMPRDLFGAFYEVPLFAKRAGLSVLQLRHAGAPACLPLQAAESCCQLV